MEELILIVAFGLIALIAMSQCAHHSSRRQEKLYPPSSQRNAAEASHARSPERPQDPAVTAVVSERERKPNGGRQS